MIGLGAGRIRRRLGGIGRGLGGIGRGRDQPPLHGTLLQSRATRQMAPRGRGADHGGPSRRSAAARSGPWRTCAWWPRTEVVTSTGPEMAMRAEPCPHALSAIGRGGTQRCPGLGLPPTGQSAMARPLRFSPAPGAAMHCLPVLAVDATGAVPFGGGCENLFCLPWGVYGDGGCTVLRACVVAAAALPKLARRLARAKQPRHAEPSASVLAIGRSDVVATHSPKL